MKINIQELENIAVSPDVPILGEVAKIKQIGSDLFVELSLYHEETAEQIEGLIEARFPHLRAYVNQGTEPKKVQSNMTPAKNINNIIAVASGKGGVGKSATAMNTALALSAEGARVGLLDADIYGPSIPTMLDEHDCPEIVDDTFYKPHFKYGIESISIGYLVEEDVAMIWRAPKIVGALMQLYEQTLWGSHSEGVLDYLVIDLPPGTGDISLTMAQKIPLTGVVTVTTPQDLALADARRAIHMFDQLTIDNLGVVENMSMHICEKCGHESHLFGRHGGEEIAKQYNMTMLGKVPLHADICQSLDHGNPLVASIPLHPVSQCYRDIAFQLAIEIAKKPKNFSQAFGKIAVESAPKNNLH